ncbi:MAG: carbohydrate binding family 9 domain-containing protein [Burkholderiales bacterium]|nr:carbohydrate binding family 9 domain-containing protein [Burkholderiales bacterium]
MQTSRNHRLAGGLINKTGRFVRHLACIALAGAQLCAAGELLAQRIPDDQPIRLTGQLDKAVWQSGGVYDAFWQTQPVDGKVAPVRTTVQVRYDSRAIYFGIRAYDPDPAQIRAPLVRRDNVLEDQDYVGVLLDPIGSGKSAMFVRVNPRGVVADGVYTADTDNTDFSPDFDVDARAVLLSDGYSAEIRIPFAVLRFPDHGLKPWQVQVVRSYPRDQNWVFASEPLPKTSSSQLDMMTTITGFQPETVDGTWSVRPEVTARTDRNSNGGALDRSQHIDLGGDVKWHPNANWVVDATVKPDFSQVELDVPQLTGNAQFALQLQEKRPFFLESSDILESPSLMVEQGGGGPKALYTRAITQPKWGIRATRRDDDTESTVMLLHDNGGGQVLIPRAYTTDSALQPESDVLLGRVRTYRDGLSLGALVSSRSYAGGDGNNTTVGPDAVWRSGQGDRVRVQWLASSTSAMLGDDGLLHKGAAQSGSYLFADWIRKMADWEPSLTLQQASGHFRDDTGFFGQSGYRQVTAQIIQKNHLDGDWTEFDPYFFYTDTVATADGATISREPDPGLWFIGPRNTQVLVEYHPSMAQRVKPGGQLHDFGQYYLEVDSNPASWFNSLTFKTTFGKLVDVANDRTASGATWLLDTKMRADGHVEIEPHLEQTLLRAPAGQISLRDTVERLLVVYHLSAQDSVRTIVQRELTDRKAWQISDVPTSSAINDSVSLTYTHRLSALRVWYVGASYGRSGLTETPTGRTAELFAKLQFEI